MFLSTRARFGEILGRVPRRSRPRLWLHADGHFQLQKFEEVEVEEVEEEDDEEEEEEVEDWREVWEVGCYRITVPSFTNLEPDTQSCTRYTESFASNWTVGKPKGAGRDG